MVELNLNAGFKISVTTTFVALDKPLFVTLITNLTKSPTFTLVALTVLAMFKTTFGSTVTLVVFEGTLVLFSVEFTVATFENVPLLMTLTTSSMTYAVPFSIFGMFHVIF